MKHSVTTFHCCVCTAVFTSVPGYCTVRCFKDLGIIAHQISIYDAIYVCTLALTGITFIS